MKTLLSATVFAMLALPAVVPADEDDTHGDDWRHRAPAEEKIERLVKVMPGTSNLMLQMGERYRNLYWAARLGQWEFAAYQAEEMESLIRTLTVTRPGKRETAEHFLEKAFPMIEEAAASRDWNRFQKGFLKLREACMECHARNDHAFIVLPKNPKTASSPVLNLD